MKHILPMLLVLLASCAQTDGYTAEETTQIDVMLSNMNDAYRTQNIDGFASLNAPDIITTITLYSTPEEFDEVAGQMNSSRKSLVNDLRQQFNANDQSRRILGVLKKHNAHIYYKFVCSGHNDKTLVIDIGSEEI